MGFSAGGAVTVGSAYHADAASNPDFIVRALSIMDSSRQVCRTTYVFTRRAWIRTATE